jgi:NhaA family Na+:H+ antiporter
MTMALDRPDLERGWAIPCATDIAFSYLVARMVFGAKHPAIPFLLLLAIADDALGLLIIAAFYPSGIFRPIDFSVFLASGMLVAWWLARRGTKTFWPYLVTAGVLSWIGFLRGGCTRRWRSCRSCRSCHTPRAIPDCLSTSRTLTTR